MKLATLLLIFLGESFSIYAELIAARQHRMLSLTSPLALKLLALIVIASACLLGGYVLGFRTFRNIWIVSAISITSVIIVEPVFSLILFGQLPTRGAFVGLLLGIMGLVSAVFF